MLDNKLLRQDIDAVCQALSRRGFIFNSELYVALENERKTLQAEVEQLKAQRNAKSKEIGIAKAAGEDVSAIMREVNGFSEQLKIKDEKLGKNLHALQELLSNVPNLPAEDVPAGKDENDNPNDLRAGACYHEQKQQGSEYQKKRNIVDATRRRIQENRTEKEQPDQKTRARTATQSWREELFKFSEL